MVSLLRRQTQAQLCSWLWDLGQVSSALRTSGSFSNTWCTVTYTYPQGCVDKRNYHKEKTQGQII